MKFSSERSQLSIYNSPTISKRKHPKKAAQNARNTRRKNPSTQLQLLADTGNVEFFKLENTYDPRNSRLSKILNKTQEVIKEASENQYIINNANFLKIEPNKLLKELIDNKNIDNDYPDAANEYLKLDPNKKYNIYVKSFFISNQEVTLQNIRKTVRVIAAKDKTNTITYIHPFPLQSITEQPLAKAGDFE